MTFDERLAEVQSSRESVLRELWALIREVRLSTDLSPGERKRLLARLYGELSPDEVRVDFVPELAEFETGVSFKAQLVEQIHLKPRYRELGYSIARGANPKEKDRAFAEALGVPATRSLAHDIPLAEVAVVPGTIIKPVRGAASRAVFFVQSDGALQALRTRVVYPSLVEAREEIDAVSRRISVDRWSVEEAVLGPSGRLANDVKVHCWYGYAGAVLEVSHATGPRGEDEFCYYDENLRPIDVGRKGITPFAGTGVPAEALEWARRLALASPAPFLRLDFLKGSDGCRLGEITPHPGATHAGHLNRAYDRIWGRWFLDAQARLFTDVLAGKQFPDYFRVYGGLDPTRRVIDDAAWDPFALR